ncbi:MAG: 50S ribosomal protein L23 [Elusimicrobia bacterium]|nr:50S ribosomal protein L23 [Elusimicrobiota bacterium]
MKLSSANVILYPAFTEKSEKLRATRNTYVFFVNKKATKRDIMNAMREIFGVKPEDVRTVKSRPKLRRRGTHFGYTSQYKKAYIKLAKGDSISGFDVV